ncbi:hypothetical protein [Clostridium chromiireducens]|uniref:Uncharacterized protein n=1 Tax=Clostridium chromiireducens TaxID=225345 RepID=A0A1V4ICB9_9CLOT|nr:hypothetical protein [Clostridium chromiireducens]OPJ57596.1 hypothetical protein CLCHR_43450 [Clostridium chromiireducens]RII33152.1 hypothetical protein D2A34_20205 [Clostridium chromiireducens]
MKYKKNYTFNDYFELFLYALAFICFIYFLIKGDIQKILQPLLIVSVLITLKMMLKRTKLPISHGLRFSILAFIFVTMFFANEFRGFRIKLDKMILHAP